MIENTSSSIGYVTSGVPQGSVVRPLFFVLFINDMSNSLLISDCYLFADECKLYSSAMHFDIQTHLDLFNKWTIENERTFNADKCKGIFLILMSRSQRRVLMISQFLRYHLSKITGSQFLKS